MSRGNRQNPYDLVIIGGGINGCGIARDCAMRGLSVALFEKNDYSTGATWASSGMIHGGLRYLKKDPDVTRLACIDSGFIQKIAPHLLFRIPFIAPFAQGEKHAAVVMELADVYFQTYDNYSPFKGGLPRCRLTAEEVFSLEPSLAKNIIGAVTTDEWGIDAARLNVINAMDAARHGADVHNYHQVHGLLRKEGRVIGVDVQDRLSGERREVFGKIVFNATGAWAGKFASSQNVHKAKVRPGKGIHLIYPGRILNYSIVSQTIDNRQIFVCPHQNFTLVGTTDDDYYGNLDDIPILEDEIDYLVEGVARVFPEIHKYRIMDTTVGCRPTLYEYGPSESSLSREHEIYDHADEGAAGFLSMVGGKLASYRIMSEEAADIIVKMLGMSVAEKPCTTHKESLPGGKAHDLSIQQFTELGIPAYAANRILYRHGNEAEGVLELLRDKPRWRRLVDTSEPVTEAELRYAIRKEHVRTLDDCKRRVRLSCGPDQGMKSALMAAQIFAEETGEAPSSVPDIALHFLAMRFRNRRTLLTGQQLQQEELSLQWAMEASGIGYTPTLFSLPTHRSETP